MQDMVQMVVPALLLVDTVVMAVMVVMVHMEIMADAVETVVLVAGQVGMAVMGVMVDDKKIIYRSFINFNPIHSR
jgi:hypothetical protein